MIYLDNAATSLIKPPSVPRAVIRAMMLASSPGRGAYQAALNAGDIVYGCREDAAKLFHADDPSRVVFTSNATHALNIAIRSLAVPGSRVLISGYEHNAVTRPLAALHAKPTVIGQKLFDPQSLLTELRSHIKDADLVICTHVSNVFGFILPIEEIASICRSHKVPLIVDASQSAGLIDLSMEALQAAFIAMPGHKALFGPQGTGILLCGRSGEPLLYGGTGSDSMSKEMPDDIPERLEAGTMNVPGIAGLREGIRYVLARGAGEIRLGEKRKLHMMIERLNEIPQLKLFTDPNAEQCGILSFQVSGTDSESFCAALGKKGIACRGGLHCAPLAHRSAGTLEQGTVRLSLSPFTDEKELLQTCRTIRDFF